MKLINGHDVIEHAEVNGESRDFIKKLTDYIEDADVVEPKKVCIGQVSFDNEELHEIVNEAVKKLKEEIEPKQGEWITEEKDSIYGKKIRLKCSECGDTFDVSERAFPYERFCRYCGARMKGADDDSKV